MTNAIGKASTHPRKQVERFADMGQHNDYQTSARVAVRDALPPIPTAKCVPGDGCSSEMVPKRFSYWLPVDCVVNHCRSLML